MPITFLINCLFITLFYFGYLIDTFVGFAYIRAIFGLPLILFVPGYNLSYLFFKKEEKLKSLERFLLSVILSVISMPLLVYFACTFLKIRITESNIILLSFFLILTTFLLALIKQILLKERYPFPKISLNIIKKWLSEYRILLLIFTIYLLIYGVSLFLYRFIPEVDPYTYLLDTEKIIKGEVSPIEATTIPFFLLYSSSLSLFSHLNPYYLFKFIFPLLFLLIPIPIYLFTFKTTRNKITSFIASLLPLTVPVIVLESEITRPQIVAMLFFPIILYFLSKSITEKSVKLWLIISLISLFGLKFHLLFIFLFFFSLFSFLILAKEEIKKNPIRSFWIFLFFVFAFFPYLRDSIYTKYFIDLLERFFRSISLFQFRIWFLNSYTNIDGTQTGWPGIQAGYYYAYNFGLVLPLVLLLYLLGFIRNVKISRQSKNKTSLFPFIFSALIFFGIAEILPRLGFYFLPDRAWPFLGFSFIFLSPIFFEAIVKRLPLSNWVKILAILAFLSSIGGSLYLVYAKQGYVSEKEYQAASFLKNQTPTESVIVSQPANQPLIEYFGQRHWLTIPENIFSKEMPLEEVLIKLKDIPEYLSHKVKLEGDKEEILNKIQGLTPQLKEAKFQSQFQKILNDQAEEMQKLIEINKKLERIRMLGLDLTRPTYILYSFDKFKYLYKMREWWKRKNFYDADLSKFNNEKYFEKVFDNEAVKIWRMK